MAGSGHPCKRDHEGYPPRGSRRERRGRQEGGGPGAAEEEGGRPDKAPETGLETKVPKDGALKPRLSVGAGQGTRHRGRPKYSRWAWGEPDLNASGSEGRPAVGSPDPGGEGRAGGTHGGCTVTPAYPTMSTCQGRGMLSCPRPLHQGDPTMPEQQVATCRASGSDGLRSPGLEESDVAATHVASREAAGKRRFPEACSSGVRTRQRQILHTHRQTRTSYLHVGASGFII